MAKVCRITWVDITCPTTGPWISPDSEDDLVVTKITTVGYLFKEYEDRVVVCTSICSDGHALQPVVIPRAVIQEFEVRDPFQSTEGLT